jgi:3-isopropylmalate dehydratase small subunit
MEQLSQTRSDESYISYFFENLPKVIEAFKNMQSKIESVIQQIQSSKEKTQLIELYIQTIQLSLEAHNHLVRNWKTELRKLRNLLTRMLQRLEENIGWLMQHKQHLENDINLPLATRTSLLSVINQGIERDKHRRERVQDLLKESSK